MSMQSEALTTVDAGRTTALVTENGRNAVAAIIRPLRRTVSRARSAWAVYQRERDLDRIVETLQKLNNRQLEALGLTRDTLYTYVEKRVDALHGDRPALAGGTDTLALSGARS